MKTLLRGTVAVATIIGVWALAMATAGPGSAGDNLPPLYRNLEVINGCGMGGDPHATPAKKLRNRLKNRYRPPRANQIAPHIRLSDLLAVGSDVNRFRENRYVSIEGHVLHVGPGGVRFGESCNCYTRDVDKADTHIELTSDDTGTATLPKNRLIVEVTPRTREIARRQGEDWRTSTLKSTLEGKWVRVSGWLYWDDDHKGEARNTPLPGKTIWRATLWEVHPIMELEVLPGPPIGP